MSDFLGSLKSDLLDRRLLPIFALLGVALLGAIAYAVLAGSAHSSSTPASSPARGGSASGIAVSAVKPAAEPGVVETTSGVGRQSAGAGRSPFTPLRQATANSAAASSTTSGTSSQSSAGGAATGASESSSGTSEAGSGSSGAGSSPSSSGSGGTPSMQKSKRRPHVGYEVSVLFGPATAGTPPQAAQLTPYTKLARQQPLPSGKQALIVFRGVIAGGKSATFTLVGEAILRGTAKCLPSASQCQAIDLAVGQTEELEYLPPGGTAITYELNVVSIKRSKASATGSQASAHESKAGLALLRKAGLLALPGLRDSRAKDVLVFASSRAFAARAHAAARGASFGR